MAARSEPARLHLNGRVLRSADALAAAAARLANAQADIAALAYDRAFSGASQSQRIRFLASAESCEGWQALALVEERLRRAYAAPAQMVARMSALGPQAVQP